ncbi:hypothetical protein GCM10011403_07780 [Pseudohongiella nitratireducens]|uniref:Isochorismatase-like domain-containing protein n=1 Tax=Pseudohongiella nitratireducens TaxID=1768907 RepID=A0A917GNW2_9GAMM|nr:isochorismatase family protein [Pseudohongiella nitratireducens]GGG53013.1 hypothetical protein GCM10011403_07780 [Pseudohongiella nitratireducens]
MGVPRIANYPLPEKSQLPAAKVDWQPDSSRAALLIHDMQQYFLAAFNQGESPINPVIANIKALLDICHKKGVPVFYTAQRGNQQRCDRGLQADFWGPGMKADAAHETIVPALTPGEDDFVLVKHRYSAFQRSNLLTLLQARQRDQLIVTGVYAQIGCQISAAEAFQHDIEPFLVADAVAAYSQAHHEQAVNYVAGCCGVSLMTNDVVNALDSH